MKAPALILILLATLAACGQEQQCVQSEFSGEAVHNQRFRQELGQGITFSIEPMGRNAQEPKWGWFKIVVVDDSKGIFAFNQSDTNWLLATPDWGSAFIGGFHSDVKRAMEYRVRDLVFPLSSDDKQKLRELSASIYGAKTSEEAQTAAAPLKSMRLGHIKFEITDYQLGVEEPPTSVDWVKFNAIVTLPADFPLSGKLVAAKLSVRYVDCPAIPDELIEGIRNPKRHEFFLPPETTAAAPER